MYIRFGWIYAPVDAYRGFVHRKAHLIDLDRHSDGLIRPFFMATPEDTTTLPTDSDPLTYVKRVKRDMFEGLAEEAIASFAKPLDEPPETEIDIKDVIYRGSYSWLDSEEPTVAIPGSPRVWLNKPRPYAVPADNGLSFIDQNAHKLPSCPALPLFVAVDTIEEDTARPKLDWNKVDFVTDRNNLMKLSGFFLRKLSNSRTFRIDIELVGRTVVMQRWEERSVVWVKTGYGDSFERESTSPGPGCEKATLAGHTRIVSYDFSGLNMVVRCEVDACYPNSDENDLVGALSALAVKDEPAPSPITVGGLHVVRAGREVAQPALIKLKTRAANSYSSFSWDGPYVQLFLGQTPTLIVGIHRDGTFDKLHERDLDTPEYENAKQRTEPALKKLRRLLDDIHAAVLKQGNGAKLSIITDNKLGVLKLVKRTDDRVLPDEVLRRFDVE